MLDITGTIKMHITMIFRLKVMNSKLCDLISQKLYINKIGSLKGNFKGNRTINESIANALLIGDYFYRFYKIFNFLNSNVFRIS